MGWWDDTTDFWGDQVKKVKKAVDETLVGPTAKAADPFSFDVTPTLPLATNVSESKGMTPATNIGADKKKPTTTAKKKASATAPTDLAPAPDAKPAKSGSVWIVVGAGVALALAGVGLYWYFSRKG